MCVLTSSSLISRLQDDGDPEDDMTIREVSTDSQLHANVRRMGRVLSETRPLRLTCFKHEGLVLKACRLFHGDVDGHADMSQPIS